MTDKLEAALLYSGFESYEPNTWLRLINEFSAGYGYSFSRTRHERLPSYLNFLGHGMTIEIAFCQDPVGAENFQNSLASEITRLEFPEARDAIQSHQQYIHFAITKGETNAFEPDPIDDGRNPPAFEISEYDFVISLLRTIMSFQIAKSPALAVYWAQCDRLFEPRGFLKTTSDLRDVSLLVHPIYFADTDVSATQAHYGIKTFGAANLIGHEVMMDPSSVPVEGVQEIILHFITMTRNTGLVMPHGDVFGRSEAESVRVLRQTESEFYNGFIRLDVEFSELYGIDKRSHGHDYEERDVDMNDPAQRALHEKIQELMAQASAAEVNLHQESDADRDVELYRQDLKAEWTGVRNKVDISKLRSLAPSNGQSLGAADEPVRAEKPRRLKRVSGFFSRK